MAQKTIPELPEIDLADIETTHLMVLETNLETYKLRVETLLEYLGDRFRPLGPYAIGVTYNGVETGVKTVDVTGFAGEGAKGIHWCLQSNGGKQLNALEITIPDDDTVQIDSSDFALPAGDYFLIGV